MPATSATSIPAASPAATSWTTRRSSTGTPSPGRSPIPASPASWLTNSCPPGIRYARSGKQWRPATFNRDLRAAPEGLNSRHMLPTDTRRLARVVLLSFVLTFIAARVVSLLTMTHHMPNVYLHVRGTHVHHLNYGIFLLAGVGAYLLFSEGPANVAAATLYGIGLGLTFDEFGMWLHLGGSYWQRASFDAVIVLLSIFGVLSFLPRWQRIRIHHYIVGGLLLASVALFYLLLFKSLNHANDKLMPRLMELEQK